MASAQPVSVSIFSLTSHEARLFVRAWVLGFVVVLLLIG
jgi:hypothetical protein